MLYLNLRNALYLLGYTAGERDLEHIAEACAYDELLREWLGYYYQETGIDAQLMVTLADYEIPIHKQALELIKEAVKKDKQCD